MYRSQIKNTHDGYIVSVYMVFGNTRSKVWHPIINFGDRQSDAIEFLYKDIENIKLCDIKRMISDFNIDDRYKKVVIDSNVKFIKQ